MSTNTNQILNKKLKLYKLLFVVCLIITLVLGVVLFTHKEHLPKSKYTFLDPIREFRTKQFYLINIQSLREFLKSLGQKYPDSVSIYYQQLNSGANISVNKDLRLFPASLSKLVQAIIIVKKVEDGSLTWDQKLDTLPTDLSSDSGELYKTIGDTKLTVDSLLSELLINSDNTAQNIFRHQLQISDYVAFQQETGLENLYNDKGFISAKEYTRILRVLYTSSYLKPENSEKILKLMSEAKFKEYLSQGIPEGVLFAHKYGENKEYSIFADSGIVYLEDRPYMLTVIIKGPDSSFETKEWAKGIMKEISEYAYSTSK